MFYLSVPTPSPVGGVHVAGLEEFLGLVTCNHHTVSTRHLVSVVVIAVKLRNLLRVVVYTMIGTNVY